MHDRVEGVGAQLERVKDVAPSGGFRFAQKANGRIRRLLGDADAGHTGWRATGASRSQQGMERSNAPVSMTTYFWPVSSTMTRSTVGLPVSVPLRTTTTRAMLIGLNSGDS